MSVIVSFRSLDKLQKLTQVRELQVFEQEVEDIQEWISDMENQLASQDLGKDLISVNNLLKEHNVSQCTMIIAVMCEILMNTMIIISYLFLLTIIVDVGG